MPTVIGNIAIFGFNGLRFLVLKVVVLSLDVARRFNQELDTACIRVVIVRSGNQYVKNMRLLLELDPRNDRKFTIHQAEVLILHCAKSTGASDLKALVDFPIVYNGCFCYKITIKTARPTVRHILKMIHGDNAIETPIAVESLSRDSCTKYDNQNRCQIS